VTKRYGFGEYYEEFLTVAPENLEPGMTGYGYLNTYDAKTETLTESSPVLMSAALENKKKKVTLSFYISNFRLMEVTQYYTKSEKKIPTIGRHKDLPAWNRPEDSSGRRQSTTLS
jgi:hypothetical protein